MTETPVSLLERLRQPFAKDAWVRFVELYTPLIYAWGRGAGLDGADAADLVQDVFVTLLQVLPSFGYDHRQSFRGWLRAVTLNKWKDSCKRKARQPRPGRAMDLADLPLPDDAEAFWEVRYREHVAAQALRVMRRDFQPATWQACWEHVVEGRPAAEVAAELGLTVGAVYAAKVRVLRRLRDELRGLLE